jgi:hypothetical protein
MKKDSEDIYIIEFEQTAWENNKSWIIKIKIKWLLIYSTISIQFLPNNGKQNQFELKGADYNETLNLDSPGHMSNLLS